VISVDTMAAHLAGALGVPTCLLLHTEADWRWMRRRADSPWYPSMTLFRQHRPGEWDAPIAAVFEDVMLRARSRAQRARGARPPATRA
jgi:ADP-heptose:LPS heptosyltransferase